MKLTFDGGSDVTNLASNRATNVEVGATFELKKQCTRSIHTDVRTFTLAREHSGATENFKS